MKILLSIFLFICVTPSFLYSLTLSELKTEIRRNLRDTDTIRRRCSDALLLNYINEAQREIVNATWLTDKTTSYVLTANTSYYNLPSDLIAIHQVYFKNQNGQTVELDELNQRSLYDTNADWETFTGIPNQYWVSNATSPVVTSSSSLQISFIPVPTSQSTGTITIWYFNKCSDLSSDGDIPFEGRWNLFPYHMSIVYQVSARIKKIEKKVDEATVYFQLYNAYLLEIKTNLGKMPNYSPDFKGK